MVVNADDFGLAVAVNEAVEIAHADGILTSASLMVAGAAVEDAVKRARALPNLRTGLHLVLVDERPSLSPREIPGLIGEDGKLRRDLVTLACQIATSRHLRDEMRAEIDAQFAAFQSTGLALDHVNAHKHFHLHPIVGSMIAEIGTRYGARAIRVPEERPALLRRAAPMEPLRNAFAEAACVGRLRAVAKRWQLVAPDHVFGLRWSGDLNARRLRALLDHLPEGLVEIYLHPATADAFPGYTRGYRYISEFAALTNEGCIDAARNSGYPLGGYLDDNPTAAHARS